jgi:hypothetical protein
MDIIIRHYDPERLSGPYAEGNVTHPTTNLWMPQQRN